MKEKFDKKSLKEGFVTIQGARQHNLKNVSLEVPRDALVVFTGISGSGKSSLAFGTLYAEAQRRYLESVSPYARRLFHQMPIPEVDAIEGLPPAVALQQQRSSGSTRSSVGSVTTLSNLLRMLYSRAGDYPDGQSILYADSFSTNTPEGACPECHGLGKIYEVTEKSMVPDDTLTIRERAIDAWPKAWQGKNLRDILVTLGYDVDTPWKDLPQKDRDWILFTDEQPQVPVYRNFNREEVKQAIKDGLQPSYKGTFIGAKKHILQTFANSQSALMKKRVANYMVSSICPACHGKRLKRESLSVTFEGYDIADISRLPLKKIQAIFQPYSDGSAPALKKLGKDHKEKVLVAQRIAEDLIARVAVLLELGLGYLSLERNTPTLSPGEHQRLRLATQVRSNLFGVVYVLDEPSAGLHPADTEALLKTLDRLKASGNSLFVVEHELDLIRHADWIVDVGPEAGEGGGKILYSGPPKGLKEINRSKTGRHLFDELPFKKPVAREPSGWLSLSGVTRNNLENLEVSFPLGVLTSVTGISGSGKSSLVSQVLVELMTTYFGNSIPAEEELEDELQQDVVTTLGGTITEGAENLKRMVVVNQKPIGRTPRSNLATYTGFFDAVRKLFATTPLAKSRKYSAGRFSFNVGKGRCANCEGEGFVMVELLFLPSVYAPCPVCNGTRYNDETLEVTYNTKNIAQVLNMTVNEALSFFKEDDRVNRTLSVLQEVGLGYLRLGQPATELSGGEAQRIKLAKELQRTNRGNTLYILDEPTTGLHPSDVEKLQVQLTKLVDAGNTVIVVEHDMQIIAASDWVIDIGPGAGDEGGTVVAAGTPEKVAQNKESKTAVYLSRKFTGTA
ncbi:excinuclease ABC subunit UvrA [Leeuwenhoekiella sp. MAR_2009_132]|uniref:excinuclease ABC subunit UvrA n=1 Tax=Leeuwenhoekiella sp. MAR_2009_132 TaxID=1392489 RepID=UPI00048F6A62|nr:excinuclease ABC subunit UvrA [Leeuwenhoekiella sp. MAR_2009_132]